MKKTSVMESSLSEKESKKVRAETRKQAIKRIKNADRFIVIEINGDGFNMTSACTRADYIDSGLTLIKDCMDEGEIPFIEKFLLWAELTQIVEALESDLDMKCVIKDEKNEEENI